VAPDAAVVVAIEIRRRDEVGAAVERLVVDQQRAKQRLLGLDRVRRDPECYKLRVSARLARDALCNGHFLDLPPRAGIIGNNGAFSIRSSRIWNLRAKTKRHAAEKMNTRSYARRRLVDFLCIACR
jgi:hypothetical protein